MMTAYESAAVRVGLRAVRRIALMRTGLTMIALQSSSAVEAQTWAEDLLRKDDEFDMNKEHPITPCGMAVLLEMDPREEKSEAGIILPGGDTRLPPTGRVIKPGTGAPINGVMMESRLKEGDHVILRPGAEERFIPLPKLGENVVLGFEPDIVAIVGGD